MSYPAAGIGDRWGGPTGLQIEQESMAYLVKHAEVSIEFLVDRILEVSLPDGSGLSGIQLSEVAVEEPWLKNYDGLSGEGPAGWVKRFDLSNWGLLAAYVNHARVGGAVIAHRTPGVDMLERRDDLAVLWDLRVSPQLRGRGIGSALFHAAEEWARSRGCVELKIETQNVNVAACRFYAQMGATLGAVNRRAYPALPDETQLLWYRNL